MPVKNTIKLLFKIGYPEDAIKIILKTIKQH